MSTGRLSGWISSVFFQEETMIFAAILLVTAVIVFIRSKGRDGLRIGSFVAALFCLIYLVFITILAIGFGSNGTRLNRIKLVGEVTRAVNETEMIKLVVDDVSPEGATYRIINNSDRQITYSYFYWLEAEKNGAWYHIKNDGMAIDLIALGTSPGEEATYDCKWTERYGSLPDGHYRLVVNFNYDWETKNHYMAGEFTLD